MCDPQTDIAKKPYNPVLGEKFQCYIDAPGTSRTSLDSLSEVSTLLKVIRVNLVLTMAPLMSLNYFLLC